MQATEDGLGVWQRITSTHLGYDLQYRVYLPPGTLPGKPLPSLYVTDGQWYLEPGGFREVLDRMITEGEVEPLAVVFVDSRNPDNPAENRRDSEFMCKKEYAAFFAGELIPAVDAAYPLSPSRDDRVILGASFGGLNAACFGLMLSGQFAGVAMQSPASGAHVDVVRELYAQSPPLPVKMFLSVGTQNDNIKAVKRFRRTLEEKGYELSYRKVRGGHDWRNWSGLLDDVLITFFVAQQE